MITQAVPGISRRELAREFVTPGIRWFGVVPSWMLMAMILLAAAAICSTVVSRSRAELQASSGQYHQITSKIDYLRRENASIDLDNHRLANDALTIEAAARTRLGMVKPNDVIVPFETLQSASSVGTADIVR